jgi:hypothetical protein
MSYWLLPSSGIPISATTVQRMTNDKKSTEEMQKRMKHYEDQLQTVFEAKLADLTATLRNVDSRHIIDPENEDPDFYDNFIRVIDDAQLKHADEIHANTTEAEVTSDPYVGMEMAVQGCGRRIDACHRSQTSTGRRWNACG